MSRTYFSRVGDTLSQSVNTIFLNGDPDESISGRSYRQGVLLNNKGWFRFMKLIDFLFSLSEKEHCKIVFYLDMERAKFRYLDDKQTLTIYKR